jgi:hypothetical protein
MKSFVKVTETVYEPLWVKPDFTTYTKDFVGIRSGFQYKCDHCEKCGHKFQLGESIGLASFKGIGNKTLCDPCAKEISI